jgi:hypothetical protein
MLCQLSIAFGEGSPESVAATVLPRGPCGGCHLPTIKRYGRHYVHYAGSAKHKLGQFPKRHHHPFTSKVMVLVNYRVQTEKKYTDEFDGGANRSEQPQAAKVINLFSFRKSTLFHQ